MFETLNDLEKITKNKIRGIIQTPNKISKDTNLLKLQNEIEKKRNIRNKLIRLFEQDVISSIKNINYKYLENVSCPMILDSRNLFLDDKLKLKIFTPNFIYANCLFSKEGLQNTDIDFLESTRISNEIKDYVQKFMKIANETNLLDNDFYEKLDILLYNKYLKKIIISGDGVRLPLDEMSKLDSYQKDMLVEFYYNNFKKILKNIQVEEVVELERYKNNINKQKVLKIYRG